MASTYSNSGIELIANGEQSGTWGTTTNTNLEIVDRLVNGVGTIALSGTSHTLTTSDGALSDGHYRVLVFSGSPSGTNTVTIDPNNASHVYFVVNTTAQSVVMYQGSGGTVTVPSGQTKTVYCDGGGAAASVSEIITSLTQLGVTASAAELNIMDGVTATTAELNILDGLTASTAELNIMDGVTATTAELNIMDGVTANTAEINILDGATVTTAELNILDGVTATAAEINVLDGITATTTELNYTDGVTSNIQTQLNGKQTSDAALTAYAGTLTAANKIPYATAPDTAGELDFKDEDNMASDSATAVPSQQSVKAYVDTEIAGINAAPIQTAGTTFPVGSYIFGIAAGNYASTNPGDTFSAATYAITVYGGTGQISVTTGTWKHLGREGGNTILYQRIA